MPTTIASTARIANAGSWAARACPAVPSATALYLCTQHTSTGKLSMWKSTDGTTWTEQDAANAPTNNAATSPYGVSDRIVGGFIAVAYFTGANTVSVRRFDTATDQWETADLGTGPASVNALQTRSVHVVLRSDGDVIVAYSDSVTTGVHYARREGTTWTTAVVVTTAISRIADLMIDPDDRAWFIWTDETGDDIRYRTLASDNTLGTASTIDSTAHTTDPLRSGFGAIFNNGVANRIAFLGRDSGGEIDLFGGTTGASTLGSGIVNTMMTTTVPKTTSAAVAFVGVGSAGRMHICWAVANGIERDFANQSAPAHTFNTDVTVLSGLTDADPCPQWVVGIGGHGILYQDNGDVKVEWIVAPTPPVTEKSGSDAADAVSDAGTLLALPTATETLPEATDAGALLAQPAATDTAPSPADAAAMGALLTGAELAGLAYTDAAAVSMLATRSATDTADAPTDAASLVAHPTAAEIVSAADDAAALLAQPMGGDMAPAPTDAAALLGLIAAADAAGLAYAEEAARTTFGTRDATDVADLAFADAATVARIVAKSASETPALTYADAAALGGLVAGADAATLIDVDAAALAARPIGSDTAPVASDVAAVIAALLAGDVTPIVSDTGAVVNLSAVPPPAGATWRDAALPRATWDDDKVTATWANGGPRATWED